MLYLIIQITQGIEDAHSKLIMHHNADLAKTLLLFFNQAEQIRYSDFVVAVAVLEETRITEL